MGGSLRIHGESYLQKYGIDGSIVTYFLIQLEASAYRTSNIYLLCTSYDVLTA